MKARYDVRILSVLIVTGGLMLTLGCAEDRQAVQQTQTEGADSIRATREAVKSDVRTLTQDTKTRIQAEKDAAKQSVTDTRSAIQQAGEEVKKEGAALKQDAEDIKQIFTEPAK